jgi:hypothetical protein
LVTAIGALALAACGGGESQDATEPSADFPVDVVTAKFPNRQGLAQTTNLRLGVENTGDQTIPDLAITIFIDEDASGAFSIRSDQPGLENANRPVWILENDYPRLAGEKSSAGAETAESNTYSFGPLDPGDTREMVWKVTPIRGGTYTVSYQVAAGLNGKAKAVTEDGSPPSGKFVVTISTKPPKATVNGAGKVTLKD